MELVILGGIILIVILQILNFKNSSKASDEKSINIDTTNLESRIEDLNSKFLKLETGLDLKIQNVISKETINISEKIGKGNSELNLTLSKNNELLNSKITDLEKNVNSKLSINQQENIRSNSSIKEEVTKSISKLNESTTETLNSTNLTLTSKFGNLENKIIKTLNDTNEQVLHKFSNLEKNINEDLNKSITSSLKTSDELKLKLNQEINNFKEKLGTQLESKFDSLSETVGSNLEKINNKVEEKLKEGFEKTNKTFSNILERLSKIDEAQKKIDDLSTDIISLQDVLTDKKSRGIFGEIQLNQVLYSIFGEKNDKAFKVQHKLSTGVIADSVLFAPEPVGTIAIDSKFPLENYKRMTDKTLTNIERTESSKAFKRDIRTHIDAISSKYIIPGETSTQAIMFLPAEAIFAEINAYHSDIVDYSQSKRVWICSPTTLMAVLTTLQVVLQNVEREKYAHVIQEELSKLSTEFTRYKTRWSNLAKHIDNVSKDVKDIHTTTEKIGKRFTAIENVDLTSNLLNEL